MDESGSPVHRHLPARAPGRLAFPVRHRLRLRQMPGGLGWRASLQWQAGLVVGTRFQDTAQDALVGAYRGRALIHPVKSPLSQTHYPFQLKAVLGKKSSCGTNILYPFQP